MECGHASLDKPIQPIATCVRMQKIVRYEFVFCNSVTNQLASYRAAKD